MASQGIKSMKKRNLVVDIMRAVGIILVVLGHSEISNSFAIRFIYLFHLPLFFVLSGYLYYDKGGEKPWEYIGTKFKSYWKEYVFYGCFLVIFHNVFYRMSIFEPTIVAYNKLNFIVSTLNSFIFNCTEPFSGALWFIPILFVSIVIFNFIQSAVKLISDSFKREIVRFFIVCVLTLLGIVLNGNNINFLYHLQTTLVVLPFLLIGFWTRKGYFKFLKPHLFLSLLCVFITCSCLYYVEGAVELSINSLWVPPLFYLCATMMIYAVYTFSCFTSHCLVLKDILSYIGQNTVSIMGLHFLAFKLFDFFIILFITKDYAILSESLVSYPEWSIIYTFIGVFLSLLIDFAIKKIIMYGQKFWNYCLT